MKLNKETADIFIPDASDLKTALPRTTHLAVGAHQDDLEIMAYHGIMECYKKDDKWFTGVVVSNGAGSARTGKFADYTDEEMQKVRREEQRKAAEIGEYAVQFQLDYPSSELKDSSNNEAVNDILAILKETSPQVVYLHNPADKHDTHIATVVKTIAAIRKLPSEQRPETVIGCEVWRDLDWLPDKEKVVMKVHKHPDLAKDLLDVFESQIIGGKRYDLATIGRRLANATYHSSHTVDNCDALIFGIDLTPLIKDDSLSIKQFIGKKIDTFRNDVEEKINYLDATIPGIK